MKKIIRKIYVNDIAPVITYDLLRILGGNDKNKLKKLFVALAMTIKYSGKIIRNIISDHGVVIPAVEIVTTTKCTLRCKCCSNLLQYYDDQCAGWGGKILSY